MTTQITIVVKPESGSTTAEAIAKTGALIAELEKSGWWLSGYDLATATKLGYPQDLCPQLFRDGE